jgi:hypothetical protein
VARALESEPAILGCGAHLLVVGHEPSSERAHRLTNAERGKGTQSFVLADCSTRGAAFTSS